MRKDRDKYGTYYYLNNTRIMYASELALTHSPIWASTSGVATLTFGNLDFRIV